MKNQRINRRDFLLKAAQTTVAAIGFPYIIPSSALGKAGCVAPRNRINMGFIGVGNMGTNNLRGFMSNSDVQVVAVCDVVEASNQYGDWYKHGWKGLWFGCEPAINIVKEHYGRQRASGVFTGCDAYVDFRELLARDDIDAVCITTPDHWHAIMAIMAAQAGKDIYGEKPLSLTIAQGRAMVDAVRRHGVVFQTGTHHRSKQMMRFACELVRNGRIGEVKSVVTNLSPHSRRFNINTWEQMPAPEGFDYDMWLGPAPWAPYHKNRCLYTFRFITDYSGGETTNTGAHKFDIVQWALGTELTGPIEIEDLGSKFPRTGLFDTVSLIHFRARYANAVELICNPKGPKRVAARFEGTQGWVEAGWSTLRTYPESLKKSVIRPNEIHLYRSNDHKRDFLNCIKTRRDPIAPVEVGHRSASICHLANIAMTLKGKLRWNPHKERFINNDQANLMLSRSMRSPWHL